MSSAMANTDTEPSDTLPGAVSTPRFDIPLPLLLFSLPLLVFFLVLVPLDFFFTEATQATLGTAILNTSAMATAIGNDVDDGDGNRRRQSATTWSSPVVDRGDNHNIIPWLQMLRQHLRQRDGDINGRSHG